METYLIFFKKVVYIFLSQLYVYLLTKRLSFGIAPSGKTGRLDHRGRKNEVI